MTEPAIAPSAQSAPAAQGHGANGLVGTKSQRIAVLIADGTLILLSILVLKGFLSALGWAVVLTVATWPLYNRFQMMFRLKGRRLLAPLLFTLVIALVVVAPLGVAVVEIWREMNWVVHWLAQADKTGLPAPELAGKLPFIGSQLVDWWNGNLSEPGFLNDLIGHTDTGRFARLTQSVGLMVARRLTFFAFTLLSLFFLFRDGAQIARRFRMLSQRLLGPPGERLMSLVGSAVRSTADGLVLVGLGEGAVLGLAYTGFGVPHPALLGAFTAILAIIPFGAPVIFTVASLLLLLIENSAPAALGLEAFGFVVIFIADHLIRPVMIGGSAKLPFIWVLLGIFGGLETFGLLGLFLGPAIMAASVSVWRDWTDPGKRWSEPRTRDEASIDQAAFAAGGDNIGGSGKT